MRSRKKSCNYRKIREMVVLVFAAVYILSMGLATWLVRGRYADDFARDADDVVKQIMKNADDSLSVYQKNGEAVEDEYVDDCLNIAIGMGLQGHISQYQQLSAGVYDEEGNLTAKSCSLLAVPYFYGADGGIHEKALNLDECLPEKELVTLAEYWGNPDKMYRLGAEVTDDGKELKSITVMEQRESAAEPGKQVLKTAWYWINPDTEGEAVGSDTAGEQRAELYLPGIGRNAHENGTAMWRRWRESQEKDPFPEKIRSGYRETEGFSVYTEEQDLFEGNSYAAIRISKGDSEECYYSLLVRSDAHPWLAAMDYLKYVYLGSLLFAAACAVILIIAMERTYRQRAQMEERRRDFTNAMAHEMKTPLSVIRGFAENLLDNPDTEKRDYYLQQMISQTEEMDGLVKEMIRISRLDSEKLVIKKEQVSLRKILEDETSGLAEQAEHIRVLCSYESDIFLEGDRELLTLAFRNLLSNAAAYNRPDGEIRICLTGEKCVIENTGDNISPEDLPHVCEMFYTGNRSRSREKYSEEKKPAGERHFGLGLYLAERILQLHGMKLQIENIADGVRVTVRRGL
ncbi:MAG TPA: HAMP domain-containing histidine kinase [Candidatus Mediterraneibacter cottocaccae]|nr:HAMP domain-containing histidine kinase [Candidatus Mediterraneibacter cottocaccae]